MMLASSSDPPSATSASSHPRRPPAHLSVRLRHESPAISHPRPTDPRGQQANQRRGRAARETQVRQPSDSSNNSEGSAVPDLQQWFDRSNTQPGTGFPRNLEDHEPPYFLPRNSSNASNPPPEVGASVFSSGLKPGVLQAPTNGSSVDEYRSVIDDLTIENKKLKEQLRKYERPQNSRLEKDRLFEVKIHSLPTRKRRELEDVLRDFASTIDCFTDEGSARISAKGMPPHPPLASAITPLPKTSSSSSTSNSRPIDSAYVSMSNSGPTSTTTLHRSMERKLGSQQRIGKEQKIQSFLHNIPEGLLPELSSVMTERQKKKTVVQRLEQLFTGYKGANIGIRSQPLQQQEVSKSAAEADQLADHNSIAAEGIREAHILPYTIDGDGRRPEKWSEGSSNETQVSRSGSSNECSPNRSPEQRPTRPLDLDPDRAQIPSENIEYIRHLGLSTPQLANEEPVNTADGESWIYLNLLINMAQLHIINVTPDFVRAAVSDVSEKLQLSRDGKKVKWRGGSQGTKLSSDSGTSSAQNCPPQGRDNLDESRRKRRKLAVGKLTSVPLNVNEVPKGVPGAPNLSHYKPLFYHRKSSPGGLPSSDESDSMFDYEAPNASGTGRMSPPSKLLSERSCPGSKERNRVGEGPIIFYSGAKFCTDLSGDRGGIVTPLHVNYVGQDGYSNHTQTALGCEFKRNAPPLFRTTSGSLLPSRPFKDCSKGPAFLQTEGSRAKMPELLSDYTDDDIDFFPESPPTSSGPPTPLQEFEASGLGGTQPADHFAVKVQTRLTKAVASHPIKMSKFALPGPTLRKIGHNIPESSLDAFHNTEIDAPEEMIAARLASLLSLSSPPPHQKAAAREALPPIKSEIITTHFSRLAPSELPPPAAYYATSSSSEDGYDSNTSSAEISHLRRDRTFLPKSFASDSDVEDVVDEKNDDSSDEMEEGDDDDDSIDMLAQARVLDPSGVAAKEKEFQMELDGREPSNLPVRSSAATLSDESGYSSDD